MKIINTTPFPTPLLRRMTVWACRRVGYQPSRVWEVKFRNRSRGDYSGRAFMSRRIVVSVGPANSFPTQPDTRPGLVGVVFTDQIEALVSVTAHELAHLCQFRDGRWPKLNANRKTELDARWHEQQALEAFRRDRDALLAVWSITPTKRPTESKSSIVDFREAKARKALQKWERKLKLAKTKVAKYRSKVRRYDRVLAAKRQPTV